MKKGLIALGVFCFLAVVFFYSRVSMAGRLMEKDDYEKLKELQEKLVYSIESERFQEAKARGEHLKEINISNVLCDGEPVLQIEKKIEDIYEKYPILSKIFLL